MVLGLLRNTKLIWTEIDTLGLSKINEKEVNGLKYHFKFMEQYSNIDSLELAIEKNHRLLNVAEKLTMLGGRVFAQKMILSEIYSSRQ